MTRGLEFMIIQGHVRILFTKAGSGNFVAAGRISAIYI